jgi:hypothetical protein
LNTIAQTEHSGSNPGSCLADYAPLMPHFCDGK